MKQIQAQKSGIMGEDPLPWHQEEMSKQLLNYSLQEKKRGNKGGGGGGRKTYYKKKEKSYKNCNFFKEKKLRG